MQIADNKVASFHYTLRNDQGEVLDSSDGGAPLAYLHGMGNIITGLEAALLGKTSGDSLSVTVAAEEAYGPVRDELIQTVPLEAFAGVEEVAEGMRFEASTASGPVSVVVTKVEGEEVTVDGNHPLAGQTLHFEVAIVEVRDATAEEKTHGHVHDGSCGHHH